MQAWRKSLKDAESTSTSTGGEDGPKSTHTSKGQSGNPVHLQVAIKALADQRNIWGLDAAPKASIPPPPPDPSEDDYLVDLSDDDAPPEPAEASEGPPAQPGEPGAA
jgi:hypothetical protein